MGGGNRGKLGCGTVIGIAIILFGVVRYFGSTQVNPTTGEKQRVALSAEQESALGLQAAPQMAQQMGGVVDPRDPDAQNVKRIGQYLVAHSVAGKNTPYQYDFHLLRDAETVNAFALPGGQIFITRGLYDRLADEAALAGVLGHEIGHVVQRHSSQQMAKSQLGQSLVTGVGAAASDQGHGYSAMVVGQIVQQTAQLKYGREHEREADEFGLRILTESGFDPRAMIDVMKVLAEASKGSRTPEWLASHPYPENRIALIQRWLSENPSAVGSLTRGRKLH
ncbi:MAG: M48 family metalloprotease [Anaerolineae bacterium]|nr:M48 family metalloprotease [Phycisphaerae bacterium]